MSKAPPFEFVFEQLEMLNPVVKPMFGCHALYVGEKIILIVRKKESEKKDNGVWVATSSPEHLESLKKEFPAARPVGLLDGKGGWLNMPEDDGEFEENVMSICRMILKRDPRIGKIPKGKKRKKD